MQIVNAKNREFVLEFDDLEAGQAYLSKGGVLYLATDENDWPLIDVSDGTLVGEEHFDEDQALFARVEATVTYG